MKVVYITTMKKILGGMVDKCSKADNSANAKTNLANSLLTLKPFRMTVVLHKVKDGVMFQFCKHHYSVHVHCLTSNPPPSDFMLALVHTHCMRVCGRGGRQSTLEKDILL